MVDATQGIQAQTISNLYLALEHDLEIIPVLNKIDMDAAMVDEVKDQIVDLLGCDPDSILAASGKTGQGVEEGARAIIEAYSGSARRSAGSAAGADFRLGVQSVSRHHRLLSDFQRLAAQGRACHCSIPAANIRPTKWAY